MHSTVRRRAWSSPLLLLRSAWSRAGCKPHSCRRPAPLRSSSISRCRSAPAGVRRCPPTLWHWPGPPPKPTRRSPPWRPWDSPPTCSTKWTCCRPEPGPGRPAATWARRGRTSKRPSNWARRRGSAWGDAGPARPGGMGRARQVVAEMEALAPKVDGDLSRARLSYTVAAADKDSQALAAAAPVEELGALLYAAEALGESAVHLRRDDSSRDAAARSRQPLGFSPAAKAPSRRSCGPLVHGPS